MKIGTLLWLGILTVAEAGATTIGLSPASATYAPGQVVSVSAYVTDVSDLFAFQFDLLFDSTVLTALNVTESDYFLVNGVSFLPGFIDNSMGTISYIADSLSGPAQGLTGDTTLVRVTFEALAPGSTEITISNPILLNTDFSSLEAELSSATLTVVGSEVAPVPEPADETLVGLVMSGGLLAYHSCRRTQES
jgi:hypothetical protein